jgi:hypothetical protein
MVAAPLTGRAGQRVAALATGALAVALLVGLAVTGSGPRLASFEPFVPAGVMARQPDEITRIELRADQETLTFARTGDGWRAGDTALRDAAAEHLARALRFLHVSKPVATLEGDALDGAAMGLDPPHAEVAVFAGDERALRIAFGGLNPSRTEQYARLEGQSGVLLLPLHVGREWQMLTRRVPDHVAAAPAIAAQHRSP